MRKEVSLEVVVFNEGKEIILMPVEGGSQIVRRGSGTVADARRAMEEMAAEVDIQEGNVERFSTLPEALASLKQ